MGSPLKPFAAVCGLKQEGERGAPSRCPPLTPNKHRRGGEAPRAGGGQGRGAAAGA